MGRKTSFTLALPSGDVTSLKFRKAIFVDKDSKQTKKYPVLTMNTNLGHSGAMNLLHKLLSQDMYGLRSMYLQSDIDKHYPCTVGQDGDIQLVFESQKEMFAFLDRMANGEEKEFRNIGWVEVVAFKEGVDKASERGDEGRGRL